MQVNVFACNVINRIANKEAIPKNIAPNLLKRKREEIPTMCEAKKIVEELRNKKSRDNRELLDRSANMIEKLAKELCEKSGCHHKCHDTKDCVVEDEAELLISNKSQCVDCIHNEICQFYKALGTTVLCYPCGFYEAKEVIANSATTKEKQIEVLKDDICMAADYCYGACDECNLGDLAESLYNAGYRKHTDRFLVKENGEIIPLFPRQSEWISVEDRLPEANTQVLAINSDGEFYVATYIEHKISPSARGYMTWASGMYNGKPTHWMPLPEAPKMKGGAGYNAEP